MTRPKKEKTTTNLPRLTVRQISELVKAMSGDGQAKLLRLVKWHRKAASAVCGIPSTSFHNRPDIYEPDEAGRYDLFQVIAAVRQKANPKQQLEQRKMRLDIANKQLDLDLRIKTLVDREYVEEQLRAAIDSVRYAGEQLGRKSVVSGLQAHAMINTSIDRTLERLRLAEEE